MDNIPPYIPYVFIAITLACIAFIVFAANVAGPAKRNSTPTVVFTFMAVWLFVIALLTFQGVFEETTSFPPRLFIAVGMTVIALITLFVSKGSRDFILKMPITTLTYLHIIRVPVELVLWWLAIEKLVPIEMTFEGSNFDILTGVTAPFAAVFLVGMRSKSTFAAVIWNIAGIVMLANIVIIAIRASPYFYNPESFAVPNIAVLQFPLIWLPTFVVPVVLFAHIASILKLVTPDPSE